MAHITRMVVVINNPTPDDYERMKSICGISRYVVAANEVGESGTPHIQAYVALKKEKKQRQAGWKKLLPRANLRYANGTEQENHDYVKKGEQTHEEWVELKTLGPNYGVNLDLVLEFGVLDHRGLDNNLFAVSTALVARETTATEIMKEYPETFVRFHRGLQVIQSYNERYTFRTWRTTGEWVYGPTGVGKSYVWENGFNPDQMWVMKFTDKGWCDGYDGQEVVIVDEIKYGSLPFGMLLSMLGSGPYSIPQRGKAPAPFLAKHIYITSCFHPKEVYYDLYGADKIDQLLDRLGTNITHMTGRSKRPVAENIFLRDIKIPYGLCEEVRQEEDRTQASSSKEHEVG